MWRWSAVLIMVSCVPALGQRLVFTMRTHPTCPVWITSVQQSKDYGFQALTFASDSDRPIASISLTVAFIIGDREEVVDGGRVFVGLEPGQRKEMDVFLGRLPALTQRAKELHQAVARAIVFVEAVDFADGTGWDPRVTVVDTPVEPALQQPPPK